MSSIKSDIRLSSSLYLIIQNFMTETFLLHSKDSSDKSFLSDPNQDRKCMYNFRKWLSVIVGCTSYIFVYFHRFSTAVLADDMAEDFGVSTDQIGILASMYFWPYGLIQPFIGALADIIEPGFMIGAANLIAAAGSLVTAFANDLIVACVGRFFVGLGCSAIFVSTNKIGVNWFSPRAFRFFAGAMIGLGGVGSLLSQTPLTLLGHAVGWRWCLIGTSILGIFLGIVAFLWVRGHPETLGFIGHSPKELTPGFKQIFIQLFKNLAVMVKIGDFWLLSGFMFFAPGVYMIVSSLWGVPYLEQIHGCTADEASLYQMSLSFGQIVGSPTMPIIAEATKSRKWTLFGFCGLATLCCVYLAFWGESSPLWLITILYFLSCFGASACQGTALPLFKEFSEERLAATLVGGGNTGPFLGGAILQMLSSGIMATYDHTSEQYPNAAYAMSVWGLCAFCCFVAMVCLLFIREPKISS